MSGATVSPHFSSDNAPAGSMKSMQVETITDPENQQAYTAVKSNKGASIGRFLERNPDCLKPTESWSRNQILWVLLQTIGGSGVVFGINFGLTLLATKGQVVTLFQFPIPMVGTYAIVIILTALGNWFVSGSLMSLDALCGRVTPLNPAALGSWWPNESSKLWRFTRISDFISPPDQIQLSDSESSASPLHPVNSSNSQSSSSNLCSSWSLSSLIQRIKSNAIIALPWILFLLITLFPLEIIISYCVWGNYGMLDFNMQPAILAGFTGSFTVLLTIPFWATMSLVNVGERYLQNK